jgi:hypothetical protein
MSQAAGPKVTSAPARGPERARQQTRVWQSPGAGSAGLRIGRGTDDHEIQADRLARQALGGGGARPVTPRLPPVPRLDAGAGGLAARIAAATPEARDLPTDQHDFFAPRFGHRFDSVRIHAGPNAAAAASAARAQAFTLGRDIYFGEGQYRPGSAAGRHLLAHELAHTLQDRPNVIARRALDTAFDAPESDPGAGAAPELADSDPAVDELATLVQAGPSEGDAPARDKLGQVPPDKRADTLASLQTRLPAADRGKVAGLGESSRDTADQPPPGAMPEVRTRDAGPAAVEATAAPSGQPAAPAHERAASAAAAKMQQAVRSVGEEAPLDGEAAALPGGLDTAGASAEGAGAAPASAAAEAAQGVTAMLGARMAELQGVAGLAVKFREDPAGAPGDPEAIARTDASRSLASRFASDAAERSQAVLAAALAVPGQAMTALGAARQAIAVQAATQGAALKQGADAARKQVLEQASRVRGAIAGRQSKADSDAARDTEAARGRARKAHDDAADGLSKRAETEKIRIRQSYTDAREPLAAVGFEAGGRAKAAADTRAAGLLAQRNGESTVLDGPIHDDRLEADAEAGQKVGAEYAKSFQGTAREQADKLTESRPEILGKVDDITTQARTGLTGQLTQIQKGADGLATGAKARSRQAATQMRAALDANAAQSRQALDTAEAQQGTALQGQADAAQAAIDGMVASALTSFGEGVAGTVQQLAGSIRSFVDSAAEMPAPDSGELAAALAESDPAPALTAMDAQVASVVPTLAGMLTEAQDTGSAALAAAAGSAAQGFAGSGAAFVTSAGGINQQSATGFQQLGASNARSATSLAADAEAGFQEAKTNADGAYRQFGDQVDATFVSGRAQLLNGLWGKESQDKLAADMAKYGKEAADHVKPRWKKVLKWVVMIVVIVAVIAVTVLSAGALGPVGVILLGAALGAAAGAVQTIADNLIDGEPWSKGVVKAMIVGAVGGAFGGAGGVLLKGVGSVALRIALEGGVNIIGGVAGEALGSVATGQAVDWTGALMGALVGAGIGAGLGIAGAIRGRVRVGGIGEPAAPPPPRPVIEAPPPRPAGRVRTMLEGAKILAPRPGGVVPEVNVGAGGGAEPAVAPEAPAAAPKPKEPIGFKTGNEAPAPAAPEAPAAAPKPKEPIGFKTGNEAPAPTAPEAPAPAPKPKEPIGFKTGTEAPTPAAPETPAAAPKPKEPIGFKTGTEAPAPAAPETAPPAPKPKEPIGFKTGTEAPAPAAPEAAPGAPRVRRLIGFGRNETVVEPPIAEPRAGAGPSPDTGATPRPRAMIVEPAAPRSKVGGGVDPARAGGGVEPIRASAEPAGGAKPAGTPHSLAEPPAPASGGTGEVAGEAAPAAAEPAAPAARESAPPGVEQQPARKPVEPATSTETPPGKQPAEPFDMARIGADTEPPQILDAADFTRVKLKPGQDALYILRDSEGTILKAGKTSASGAKNRFSVYKRAAKLAGKEVQLEVHPLNPSKNIAEYYEKLLRTNLESQGHALPWDNTGQRLGPGFGTPGEGQRTPPVTRGEMIELLQQFKGNLREIGTDLRVHRQTVRLWAKSLGLNPLDYK